MIIVFVPGTLQPVADRVAADLMRTANYFTSCMTKALDSYFRNDYTSDDYGYLIEMVGSHLQEYANMAKQCRQWAHGLSQGIRDSGEIAFEHQVGSIGGAVVTLALSLLRNPNSDLRFWSDVYVQMQKFGNELRLLDIPEVI